MRRREFLGVLGGAAAGWPLAAHAQQSAQPRRIGVLMNFAAGDPQGQARFAALLSGLRDIGWADGSNLGIELRWTAGDADRTRKQAAEMVDLAPDVVLASGGIVSRALQQAGRTQPIVFVNVADPIGGGLITSLAHPGGNITGFTQFEYVMSGKWLELLKEIAPHVKRVAVLRDPTNPAAIGQLGTTQTVAPSFGVDITPIDVRDAGEIGRILPTFARVANGGMILLTGLGALTPPNRDLIMTLAVRHQIPSVFPYRYFVTGGGLLSYGPDPVDPYRRAAGYVDRILKGEKPADLPVQAPTKYELAINLKTAKALGLTVPPSLLARADEVIE